MSFRQPAILNPTGIGSGAYIVPAGTTTADASNLSNVSVLDVMYLSRTVIPRYCTGAFDRIGLELTVGGAVGSIVRLGVYDDVGGLPGNLVQECGSIDGTVVRGRAMDPLLSQWTVTATTNRGSYTRSGISGALPVSIVGSSLGGAAAPKILLRAA